VAGQRATGAEDTRMIADGVAAVGEGTVGSRRAGNIDGTAGTVHSGTDYDHAMTRKTAAMGGRGTGGQVGCRQRPG